MASTLQPVSCACCEPEVATTTTTSSSGALLSFASMAAFYAANVTGIPANGCVEILGYYNPGDGGGGLFRYDPLDVSSPDDGGRILVNGTRKFKRVINTTDPILPEFFGAVANVATQAQAVINTAAFRKCVAYYNRIDALGAAGYPDASASPSAYTYYIDNDIRVTNGTRIRGAGKGRTSIKLLANNAQVAARVAAGNGYFYAIIETNTAADALVGEVYGLPYGKSDNVVVEDLTLDGNASNIAANRCTIQGTDVRGCNFNCRRVLVTGVSSSSPGYSGTECFPIFATFHADTTDATGHKVVDCEVTGAADGGTAGGGREISAITLSGRSGLLARGIVVTGCWVHDMTITASQPSSLHGISLGYSEGSQIIGNVVSDFDGAAVYIDTGTLKESIVADNLFDQVRFGVYYACTHSGGGVGSIYVEDALIHDNIINLISTSRSVDPGVAFYGVVLGVNAGVTELVFNRLVVRENTVYGTGFTQTIANLTGDTTNASTLVTGVTAGVMHAGYFVTGAGIPANATCLLEPGALDTFFYLSAAATATATGVALTVSQKYYPRGFGLLVPAAANYSGVLVQDNVFETPDVGILTSYYFATTPYSLAGYFAFTYSFDATRAKWAFNRNKLGEAVPATVVYYNYYPAFKLFGGGIRNETFNPNEWPTDIDESWYNETTRARFSAKKLFDEVPSGDIQIGILYQVALGLANTDIVEYNDNSVANCATTNTSPIITVPDTAQLGLRYLVEGSGIPLNSYITEINGPTTVTISQNATATASPVTLRFLWRAALSGNRAGVCNYTNASTNVTCADTSLLGIGEEVVDAAFLNAGTRISAITGPTAFTVSAAAIATGSSTPYINPAAGALGNGGTFDGINGESTYTATGVAKVYEHVSYSWQIEGSDIWQYGSASTYVSAAILDRDRMFYGHFSVVFGTDDSEKYVYLPDPADYAGREFFLVVKKGATTGARAINLRVGTPSAYNVNKLLAPGVEFETDASGYVNTVPLTRPTTGVALSGIRLRAQVDGLGWMLQARSYEAESKTTFTPVTTATTATLLDSNHQLEGVVQVIFDTTDTDKSVALPAPSAAYAGRKFKLIAYKSATAGSRKVSLVVNGGGSTILNPFTSTVVASYVLCNVATGVVACGVDLFCDGTNWIVTPIVPLQVSEAYTGGSSYALTNAYANVTFGGSAQSVSLPIPGTYLVTYSYGVAGPSAVAPHPVYSRLNDSVAGAIAKSVAGSTPQDKDVDDSDQVTKTFIYTSTSARTLTLQAYQDTAATATIYSDYTYVGAVLLNQS